MAEEGFHEIQLNSKQLVFLFMATAVVAAVIFLSGVMVGRGVRAEKEPFNEASTLAAQAAESPAGGSGTQIPPASAVPSGSPALQGQAPGDELSYYSRLGAGGSPKDALKAASPSPTPPATNPQTKPAASTPPSVAKPASVVPPSAAKPTAAPPAPSAAKPTASPAPPVAKPTAQAPPPAAKSAAQPPDTAATRPPPAATAKEPAAPPKPTASVPAEGTRTDATRTAEPAGNVFCVQVGALRNRDGADAMVKELLSKGYDAYLVAPQAGSALYRVRVGRRMDRRDAEEIKRRLEKEDYRPLITR